MLPKTSVKSGTLERRGRFLRRGVDEGELRALVGARKCSKERIHNRSDWRSVCATLRGRRPASGRAQARAPHGGASLSPTVSIELAISHWPNSLSCAASPASAASGVLSPCARSAARPRARSSSAWRGLSSALTSATSGRTSSGASPDKRLTTASPSHPVELVGSDHNPSCSRASRRGLHRLRRRFQNQTIVGVSN